MSKREADLPIDEVICADCMDEEVGLPSLPEGSVDLVLTDPPYGISGGGGVRTRRVAGECRVAWHR